MLRNHQGICAITMATVNESVWNNHLIIRLVADLCLLGIRSYLSSSKRPTLKGFIKKEELACLDYIEQFSDHESAKTHLLRRYTTLHKNLIKAKPLTDHIQWQKLWEKSKTREELKIAAL